MGTPPPVKAPPDSKPPCTLTEQRIKPSEHKDRGSLSVWSLSRFWRTAGRECSENFGGSAILAVRRTLTRNRGEYLRVVGIHSDG